jgi:hypothetical protein
MEKDKIFKVLPLKTLLIIILLSSAFAGIIYFITSEESDILDLLNHKNQRQTADHYSKKTAETENISGRTKSITRINEQFPSMKGQYYQDQDRFQSNSFILSSYTPVERFIKKYHADFYQIPHSSHSGQFIAENSNKTLSAGDKKDSDLTESDEIIDRELTDLPVNYVDGIDEIASQDITGEMLVDNLDKNLDSSIEAGSAPESYDSQTADTLTDLQYESYDILSQDLFEMSDSIMNDLNEMFENADSSETEEKPEKIMFMVNYIEFLSPKVCIPQLNGYNPCQTGKKEWVQLLNEIMNIIISNHERQNIGVSIFSESTIDPDGFHVVHGEGSCVFSGNEVTGCVLKQDVPSQIFDPVKYNPDYMSPFCSNNPLVPPPCFYSEKSEVKLSFFEGFMNMSVMDGYFFGNFIPEGGDLFDDWRDYQFLEGYIDGYAHFDDNSLDQPFELAGDPVTLNQILPKDEKIEYAGQSLWHVLVHLKSSQVQILP